MWGRCETKPAKIGATSYASSYASSHVTSEGKRVQWAVADAATYKAPDCDRRQVHH